MLDRAAVSFLQNKKVLLGFSGGVDSSALFFLLKECGIRFDIAIVDYCLREQSKEEILYAQELAQKFDLRCFQHESPPIKTNFEATARAVRYDFFETLINSEGYEALVLAHQLDDRIEWMLMRLAQGAGLAQIVGMRSIDTAKSYAVVRPLLGTPKSKLLEYLRENEIVYFEDESNDDEKYLRNSFRKRYAVQLSAEFHRGFAKSFELLQQDCDELFELWEPFCSHDILVWGALEPHTDIHRVDLALKKVGYLASLRQKREIQSSDDALHDGIVLGGKFVVAKSSGFWFVCRFTQTQLPKKLKERCRKARIPSKVRPYLASMSSDGVFLLDVVTCFIDSVNPEGKT